MQIGAKSSYPYDVSAIIINRNGGEVTKKCVSLMLKEHIREIIVVDNNSNISDRQFLESLKKKGSIKLICNDTNHGYAEANNQGFRIAHGKYILFLNNDTIPKTGFIKKLISKLIKTQEIAAVQPLILFPDGTIDSVGSFLTPTGFLYHRAHRQKPNNFNSKCMEVYSLKGACMLWKKDVLKKIGVFDDSYFAYFEETELCNRAIRHGYKLFVEPSSSIIHLGGFTSNRMDEIFIQKHNTQNRIRTYIRHLPIEILFYLLFFHLITNQAFIFYLCFKKPKLAFFLQFATLKGLFLGIVDRLANPIQKYDLKHLIKSPDLGYYLALFSSLKGYDKLW